MNSDKVTFYRVYGEICMLFFIKEATGLRLRVKKYYLSFPLEELYPLKNTVIFIEENNEFVFTKEFASYVKESGNYFVFVTRAPLKMLPYSIHEIYEIITDGKRTDIKESYHEFKAIYSNYPIIENNKIQNVVTEDSNSGYQFWMHAE